MTPPDPSRGAAPVTDADSDADVVIVGGAFAGAAAALLLAEQRPGCRIVLAELAERFTRRVGEATVEVSGMFASRVLGLWDHLAREHLPKHGLRYWFSDGDDRPLAEMTEVGGGEVPRLPSFQLDRAKLDEHLLVRAADSGCEVLRPAKVRSIDHGWPTSRVHLETPDGERTLTTRWVIDASGRRALVARRQHLLEKIESHPTAALWARWRGVADLDGPAGPGPLSACGRHVLPASRRLATNHFCGYGWWVWMIPLAGGETSIGLVYDKDLLELPTGGSQRQRYETFLRSRPGLGELLTEASVEQDGDGDDFMALAHLPYKSRRYMAPGWALVGDAAAFIDPFYSPGLDHAAISVSATVDLLARELGGELDATALESEIERHNQAFDRSYDRWLDALYRGKYELMGDAELMACCFIVDTALYHLGVVTPVYHDTGSLKNPVFGLDVPQATIAYHVMRLFNRRMVSLARTRRRLGIYGRRNVGHQFTTNAFGFGLKGNIAPLARAAKIWLRLEVERWLAPFLSKRPLGRATARPAKAHQP